VIEIVCDRGEVDAICDVLWIAGASGIAELENTAELKDTTGRVRLLAGFPLDHSRLPRASRLVEHLARQFPDAAVGFAGPTEPTWRLHATPWQAGPFTIRLPEHRASATGIDLCIEPGEAFGTGSHPSTRLAIAAMASVLGPRSTVADVGTGTGVLAIAAALLGAARVEAVDVDAASIEITLANARANAVDITAHVGSAASLQLDHYDVVTANVTAATQRALAPALAGRAATSGRVILSGLLVGQVDSLSAEYGGFEIIDDVRDGEWACIVLARGSSQS
jgi:ribosomal protein L11 methylase PrmA